MITAENITTIITLFLLADRILRAVAPLTNTDIDDKIVAEIDQGKAFVQSYAPAAFTIAEQLANAGAIAKGGKAKAFLDELKEAFEKSTGKQLSDGAVVEANLLAKGLAAAGKVSASKVETPVNPQTAPASR